VSVLLWDWALAMRAARLSVDPVRRLAWLVVAMVLVTMVLLADV
jgi:hypothetical protein